MTGSVALDVVIGLVFIYLLYALLATIVEEAIANVFSFRAKFLQKAITRMLEDGHSTKVQSFLDRIVDVFSLFTKRKPDDIQKAVKAFYAHPLIKYLAEDEHHSRPAYITAQNFSKTLLDLLKGEKFAPGDDPKEAVMKALQSGELQWKHDPRNPVVLNDETLSYLRSMWAEAQGDVNRFRVSIEDWFNNTMERTSGWYKKHTQAVLLMIGMLTAVIFNVDTIKIVGKLSHDPTLREQMVKQADTYVKEHASDLKNYQIQKDSGKVADKNLQEIVDRSTQLWLQADSLVSKDIASVNNSLALGWSCQCKEKNKACEDTICIKSNFSRFSILGWLITALALSLGAPFWFDLLSKLMKIKGSISTETKTNNKGVTQDTSDNTIKPKG